MAIRRALVVLLLLAAPLAAQHREVHGESDVFAAPGALLAWGVLRGATDADALVVVRIVRQGERWGAVSAEAVDPFSGQRELVMTRRPVGRSIDLRRPRASYADFPRLELHFHPSDPGAGEPGLTVYYLGVPDTTPEFQSEATLSAHLDSALARLRPVR